MTEQRFKAITIIALLFISLMAKAQSSKYKECEACVAWETHKGKVNHGKSYCVTWVTVRDYKDGNTDSLNKTFSVHSFNEDEYENYQKLSERGKYIVDSLKEDGVTQLQQSYLSLEPVYMKEGKKTEQLWSIEGDKVVMYEYSFWKSSKGYGTHMIKESIVK